MSSSFYADSLGETASCMSKSVKRLLAWPIGLVDKSFLGEGRRFPSILVLVKSRSVSAILTQGPVIGMFSFWEWLTWIVLDKGH